MPGVRATSVRRTVVVAMALVTGQALLGGFIGFVTFGGDGVASPPARAAEPQFAGPPVALPPSDPTAEPAKRPRTAGPTTRTRGPTSPPAPARSSATRAISPSPTPSAAPAPVPPPVPSPSTSPTDRSLLPPSPPQPVADPTVSPVPVVDERCDDEGATGRTADGQAVRCERGDDGELRWRPV